MLIIAFVEYPVCPAIHSVYEITVFQKYVGQSGAYPRFQKWGTKHGERQERGAAGAEGVGRACPPLHQGRGLERGLCLSHKYFRFLSSKWQVIVHSGS